MIALDILLLQILVGYFMLVFYQKIAFQKFRNTIKFFCGTFIYVFYMTSTYGVVLEPFRTMLGVCVLGIFIANKRENIQKTALALSFIIITTVRLAMVFVMGVISFWLGIESLEIVSVALLFPSMLLAYLIISAKANFSYVSSAIREFDIQGVVFSSAILILLVYSLTRSTSREFFVFAFVSLCITIFVMGAFIIYAVWNYRSKNEIVEEKIVLYDKNKKLTNALSSLKSENQNLISRWHEVKEIVTANNLFFTQFEKELFDANAAGVTESDLLKKINQIKIFNSEMGDDLSLADLEEEIEMLSFPNQWIRLKLRLAHFMYESREKNIDVIVENNFENWNKINFSEAIFIKLISNIVSNAIKELEITDIDVKLVKIKFLVHADDYFSCEVHDNAHEFSMNILENLGIRQNSTNDTGDGYFEIFKILDTMRASFEIVENINNKMIRLIFDGNNDRMINSNYRVDELLLNLENSILDVL